MSVAIDLAKVNALLTSVISIVTSQELLKGKDISPRLLLDWVLYSALGLKLGVTQYQRC